jgi:hypothetical protein
MHLMGMLEKHSEDLMQQVGGVKRTRSVYRLEWIKTQCARAQVQVDFVEKQLVRNNAANDERTLVDQKVCMKTYQGKRRCNVSFVHGLLVVLL